ncbi:hypothetical protein PFICI_06516 [Pestalotiopsis fici W106-1]|uniref:Uncharacterized protein n=1 Tax=Pestalotiopsis fici (strain W106-1 / CGMCC3.15140) TaxID=1229662 RepID=W3X651_PESFW|nr:uncharacterized protein PFICI_06516 [Pestalotiopsis fici W106-1]ETS81514.1 hypothetical protein PFICI_06516 [Pestalotiopsis fici W106-1]
MESPDKTVQGTSVFGLRAMGYQKVNRLGRSHLDGRVKYIPRFALYWGHPRIVQKRLRYVDLTGDSRIGAVLEKESR